MGKIKEGPQPLSIEEYRRRQQQQKPKEARVPVINRVKRRGGYTQKLKREKSILLRTVNSNPPPSWDKATQLWKRISEIEFLVEQYIRSRKN